MVARMDRGALGSGGRIECFYKGKRWGCMLIDLMQGRGGKGGYEYE